MRTVCCPKCGKTFFCSHDTTCFCTRYHLSKESAAFLREKFHDCLCEDCLKGYATQTTATSFNNPPK